MKPEPQSLTRTLAAPPDTDSSLFPCAHALGLGSLAEEACVQGECPVGTGVRFSSQKHTR